MNTRDLAIVGNGTTSALVSGDGTVVWCSAPGFDGDPVFCSLLEPLTADLASSPST
jgi:hypothetical protein